jgi:4a-hydroxytetrahydrobiopterin dehydratase
MARPKKLEPEQIKTELNNLKDQWVYDPLKSNISVTYNCPSFSHTMLLANGVAHIAEKVDHHPAITIDYKKITFCLSTHDAGGLTELDFKLARHIETLQYKPQSNSEW